MHNLGSSVILADEQNFYISYIDLMSLGTEQAYNISACIIQLLYYVDVNLSSNSTTRTRPDFVGDSRLRPGLRQRPVGSAWVSDKSADFVWL